MQREPRNDGAATAGGAGDEPGGVEWDAFRQRRDRGDPFPHLGTAGYHFRPPGLTRIQSARATDEALVVELEDGRRISVPWDWFPILRDARPEERAALEVWPEMVRFPRLFTEVTTSQLLVFHDPTQEAEHIARCASPGREEPAAAALVARILRRRGDADPEAVLRAIAERVRRRQY